MPRQLPTTGPALITGASSGLGAEFARQLAARRHDLLLVARRRDALEALATRLERDHGVSVEVLPTDLSDEGQLEELERRLARTGDVRILINNAGFGHGGDILASPAESQQAMLRVHMEAPHRLIRAVLPGMLEAGSGAVVNVASVAALGPVPGSASYSATKMFLVRFSQGLALEMEPRGVRLQALCPGFVHTGFHDTPQLRDHFDKSAYPPFLWMRAEKVVRASLRELARGRRVVVVPGAGYRVLAWLAGTRFMFRILRWRSRREARRAD